MRFEQSEAGVDYPVSGASRLVPVARVGFYGLLFAAAVMIYAMSQFRGLRDPAAMEMAETARNLAEGRGYVTRCARPFDLWYLAARGRLPATPGTPLPVLWTAPGYPALQAIVFRMMRVRYVPRGVGQMLPDAETRGIVPLGAVLTLAGVLAVWLLGRLLFDARTALLAAGAYAVSDRVLSSAISGLPLPLLTLALTLAAVFALLAVRRTAREEKGWGVAGLTVLSAMCAAVAVLSDYTMIVVAVALAVFLWLELQRRRWLHTPLYLLALALALLPWLLRNHAEGIGIIGAVPFAALHDTGLFPGDSLERVSDPVFNVYRVTLAVRQGIAGRILRTATDGGFAGGSVMFCFFVLAIFHRYEYSVCRTFKRVTLLTMVVLPAVAIVPGGFSGGWAALYPFIVLFGMSAFTDYTDREEYFDTGVRPLLPLALLLLCMLPAGLRIFHGAAPVYPPYYAPIQRFVGDLIAEHEILLTDIPQATAWYGGCFSLQLPTHPDDVAALPGGWDGVGGIYLTAAAGAYDPLWTRMLLNREVPEAVPLRHGLSLPTGRSDQLLLIDRPRWEVATDADLP